MVHCPSSTVASPYAAPPRAPAGAIEEPCAVLGVVVLSSPRLHPAMTIARPAESVSAKDFDICNTVRKFWNFSGFPEIARTHIVFHSRVIRLEERMGANVIF